jgi:hypothetical protein
MHFQRSARFYPLRSANNPLIFLTSKRRRLSLAWFQATATLYSHDFRPDRPQVIKPGADPAPGRGGLEPPLPSLGPWSPS